MFVKGKKRQQMGPALETSFSFLQTSILLSKKCKNTKPAFCTFAQQKMTKMATFFSFFLCSLLLLAAPLALLGIRIADPVVRSEASGMEGRNSTTAFPATTGIPLSRTTPCASPCCTSGGRAGAQASKATQVAQTAQVESNESNGNPPLMSIFSGQDINRTQQTVDIRRAASKAQEPQVSGDNDEHLTNPSAGLLNANVDHVYRDDLTDEIGTRKKTSSTTNRITHHSSFGLALAAARIITTFIATWRGATERACNTRYLLLLLAAALAGLAQGTDDGATAGVCPAGLSRWKWEFETGGDVDSSPALSSDDKTVFVGSRDNNLGREAFVGLHSMRHGQRPGLQRHPARRLCNRMRTLRAR